MDKLPSEFYYWAGFLIMTNLGAIFAWLKSRKDNQDEEKKKEIQFEVEKALMQQQMTALTISIGELKQSFKELKDDFNGAYGKWREKNG